MLRHYVFFLFLQFCEYTEGQSLPHYAAPLLTRTQSSDSKNNALVVSLSATAAVVVAGFFIALFVVVKRRRNGVIHSTLSPKSIREADSMHLEPDGQVLRQSLSATTSGGELLTANSHISLKSSSSSRHKIMPTDTTEGEEEVEIDQEGV